MEQQFERVRVTVETTERSFRGYLYRPLDEPKSRLSDYLNRFDRPFLCLSDVTVNDRGQTHRPGEHLEFAAVSTSAITFIAPMQAGE